MKIFPLLKNSAILLIKIIKTSKVNQNYFYIYILLYKFQKIMIILNNK